MTQVERICPNCGTSNPAERTNCLRCGMDLVWLPATRPPTMPARADQARAAALVIGATALIARASLELLVRGILPRLMNGRVKPSSSSLKQRRAGDQPDYIVRGWRAWSVHWDDQHSAGSEQFEWRINRTRDR